MKNKLFKIMLFPLFVLFSFLAFDKIDDIRYETKLKSTEITQVIEIEWDSVLENRKQSIRQELIDETKNYISKVTKRAHVDIIAPRIVDQSLGNNIDLCFVLAQCQIETEFGTTGIGRAHSKKSMFGINKSYQTYEECIDHYIKNLMKNYLSHNRGPQELMRNYTTKSGHRYAEDTEYEIKLKNQYNKIKKNTEIRMLEQKYNNLISDETLI